MLRYFVPFLFCLGISIAQPTQGVTPAQIASLQAKMDSLARELDRVKFESGVTKEVYSTGQASLNSNFDRWTNGFSNMIAGVFAFMAIIGIIQYRVSRNEAKNIHKEIEAGVLENFANEHSALQVLHSNTAKSLETMEESVKLRNEKALSTIDEKVGEIRKSNIDYLNHFMEIARLDAIAEALWYQQNYSEASKRKSEEGILIHSKKFEGYENRLIAIGNDLLKINQSARGEISSYVFNIVKDFAKTLSGVDHDLQKRIYDEFGFNPREATE